MGTGTSHGPQLGVPINPRVGYADQLARKEKKNEMSRLPIWSRSLGHINGCQLHATPSGYGQQPIQMMQRSNFHYKRHQAAEDMRLRGMGLWSHLVTQYVLLIITTMCLPVGVWAHSMDDANMSNVSSSFKEVSIPIFQHHLRMAHQQPICIVYHSEGETSGLEESIKAVWKSKAPGENYSSWQFAGFPVNKYDQPSVPIPGQVPLLRCFLGKTLAFDYAGKPEEGPISDWLKELSVQHHKQWEEASVEHVKQITNKNKLTLLGFSDFHHNSGIEGLLSLIRDKYRGLVHVLLVHAHSPDIRRLQSLYNVSTLPTFVFIENSVKTHNKPVVVKVLTSFEVSMEHIDVYLMTRNIPAVKLNPFNFEDIVLFESRSHQPMLVCFYAWWAKNVTSYLSQFQRTVEEYHELATQIRFGMLEINQDSQHIIGRHVKPVMAKKFPFIVLFRLRMKKTTVDGIDHVLYTDSHPTPWNIYQFLKNVSLPLLNSERLPILYQPWGSTMISEISLMAEGPLGNLCSLNPHNETDNDPAPPFVFVTKKKQTKSHKEGNGTEQKSWHDIFSSEKIHSKLLHIGSLLQITDSTWAEVIETSHATFHPLMTGTRWQGEVTKVALVIFIMADCNSCERNMNLFDELSKAVSHIEGGSAYIMNCTSDPSTCNRLGIRGFPMLSAFRGVGWMDGHDCVSNSEDWEKYIRMDYYGVISIESVMSWFSDAAAAAITNVKFDELDNDEMEEDVRLVATLIPKGSRFLPKVLARVRQDSFYPFKCFRLACERLYGRASCYVQYSHEIPQNEYTDGDDKEMVVTQVELFRSDGLSAFVMRLGQTLISTMEHSSDMSIHRLHRPHRYRLHPGDRCEDHHGQCTDLLVQFTYDHGRLPISAITASTFHMKDSLILSNELPVMVTLVHAENITADSKFYKSLLRVAEDLYSQMIVVTVDVDRYPAWVARFVPKGYLTNELDCTNESCLYNFYPRMCVIWWNDHHRAAFYPPLETNLNQPFHFMKKNIIAFAHKFIGDPDAILVETEHF